MSCWLVAPPFIPPPLPFFGRRQGGAPIHQRASLLTDAVVWDRASAAGQTEADHLSLIILARGCVTAPLGLVLVPGG